MTPTPGRMRRQDERGLFRQKKRARAGISSRTDRTRKRESDYEREAKLCRLETRIDFITLAGRIDQLSEKDNPQRKTVFTLLDKVREPILAARRHRRVSYRVLANELRQAGLQVSEPTLRKYLQAQGVVKKPRKRGERSIEATPKLAPQSSDGKGSGSKPTAPSPSPGQKLPVASKQHRFNLDI